MHWDDLHHSELTSPQLYQILKLRNTVFIVEQQCIYQDIDGQDLIAQNRHILGWQGSTLAAYARILLSNNSELFIGRVIVAPNFRGTGLGYQLMTQAITSCKTHFPNHPTIHLSAQARLQKFYNSLGFIPKGDLYDEDGISHIKMVIND